MAMTIRPAVDGDAPRLMPLMDAAIEELQNGFLAAAAEGFATMELMATRSGIPLYEAVGFQAMEELEDDSGGVPIPLRRMLKAVTAPQSTTESWRGTESALGRGQRRSRTPEVDVAKFAVEPGVPGVCDATPSGRSVRRDGDRSMSFGCGRRRHYRPRLR
jgi:hypothetical protein